MPKPVSAVTVTITGAPGAGKTRIGDLLRDALTDAGGRVHAEKCGDDCESPESLWGFGESVVRIIEKQV